MNRIATILLLFVLCAMQGMAQRLTADEALSRAKIALNKGKLAKVKKTDGTVVNYQLAAETPAYYVFTTGGDGFIIAGAEQKLSGLLGYTENGTYEDALNIPAFREWLAPISALALQAATANELETPMESAKNTGTAAYVQPLLGDIKWDQNAPFHNMTPMMSDSEDTDAEHCVTGCAATAMAQIMGYYRWPDSGVGSYGYVSPSHGFELYADFSASTYDWDNMLGDYRNGYTEKQGDAVAKLMSDVGIAMNMDYDTNLSGAANNVILYGISNFFKYSPATHMVTRDYYTTDEWNDMMRIAISNGHPLLFTAYTVIGGGHAFVIDGYDTNGMYHVNWGWSGMGNGYFDINYLDPGEQGAGGSSGAYSIQQLFFAGLMPEYDVTSYPDEYYDMLIAASDLVFDGENAVSIGIANTSAAPLSLSFGCEVTYNGEMVQEHVDDPIVIPALVGAPYIFNAKELCGDSGEGEYVLRPIYYLNGKKEYLRNKLPYKRTLVLVKDSDGMLTQKEDLDSENTFALSALSLTLDKEVCTNYKAKFTAEVKNLGNAELNQQFVLNVINENGELVAMMRAMDFVYPGETSRLHFTAPQCLAEGWYQAAIFYVKSDNDGYMCPGNSSVIFHVDAAGEESLSYSDFALSTDVVATGDTLTGSFTVTSTGVYTEKNYVIAFYPGDKTVTSYTFMYEDAPVKANSTTPISISGKVTMPAGEYRVVLYENTKDHPISNALSLTVVDTPTGIAGITINETPTAIYDLMGREVKTPLRGRIYVRNGKKWMK